MKYVILFIALLSGVLATLVVDLDHFETHLWLGGNVCQKDPYSPYNDTCIAQQWYSKNQQSFRLDVFHSDEITQNYIFHDKKETWSYRKELKTGKESCFRYAVYLPITPEDFNLTDVAHYDKCPVLMDEKPCDVYHGKNLLCEEYVYTNSDDVPFYLSIGCLKVFSGWQWLVGTNMLEPEKQIFELPSVCNSAEIVKGMIFG